MVSVHGNYITGYLIMGNYRRGIDVKLQLNPGNNWDIISNSQGYSIF